ncbi:MAG: PASTA domain-containing protein, partial [Rhodococcus sp.]|nr:PASTA domain-containing protein [Rhodococcus sp. (in: high G+C Gram-positive bacteria)]
DGNRCEPLSFTKITDANGNDIAVNEPECRQVIDAELARQTTSVLEEVVEPGSTGSRAILANGRPVAGKTGTANMDWHAWFMGYTPQLATAVWQGHHEGYISMFNSVINGQFHQEVYGGLYPAMTFKMFMDTALADEPMERFTAPTKDPRSIQGQNSTTDQNRAGTSGTVPNLVGQSQQEAQSAALANGYGYTTRAEASDQPQGTVIRQVPGPGENAARGTRIEIWISAGGG